MDWETLKRTATGIAATARRNVMARACSRTNEQRSLAVSSRCRTGLLSGQNDENLSPNLIAQPAEFRSAFGCRWQSAVGRLARIDKPNGGVCDFVACVCASEDAGKGLCSATQTDGRDSASGHGAGIIPHFGGRDGLRSRKLAEGPMTRPRSFGDFLTIGQYRRERPMIRPMVRMRARVGGSRKCPMEMPFGRELPLLWAFQSPKCRNLAKKTPRARVSGFSLVLNPPCHGP